MAKCSEQFQEVVDACSYLLREDNSAEETRNYLNSRLEKEIQKKYQFGYFPDDKNLHKLINIVDTDILYNLKLMYSKNISGGIANYGLLSNHNLIMPFKDSYGDIISLLGRTILPSEEQKERQLQKYKYTINSNKDLYVFGLDLAKNHIIQKNCVLCVEGQFDFISCYENGIKNIVAFGWANLSKYQFFQIHRYTKNIYLLLDNDEAGQKASIKIKNKFSKWANIRYIKPIEGFKDINEVLSKKGKRSDKIVLSLKEINRRNSD